MNTNFFSTIAVLIIVVWCLVSSSPLSAASAYGGQPIRIEGRKIGWVKPFDIELDESKPRQTIELSAVFPNFSAALDAHFSEKGNLRSCSNRFYWRGDTSIDRIGHDMRLSSDVAYEKWNCEGGAMFTFKIFGVVGTIDWILEIRPAPLQRLYIDARVTNIRGVDNNIEKLFGLRFSESIPIPLPPKCGICTCTNLAANLDANLSSVNFSRMEDDIILTAKFSASSDIGNLFACFAD